MLSDSDLGAAAPLIEATGTGDGMLDAAIAALGKASGITGQLTNFQVQSDGKFASKDTRDYRRVPTANANRNRIAGPSKPVLPAPLPNGESPYRK